MFFHIGIFNCSLVAVTSKFQDYDLPPFHSWFQEGYLYSTKRLLGSISCLICFRIFRFLCCTTLVTYIFDFVIQLVWVIIIHKGSDPISYFVTYYVVWFCFFGIAVCIQYDNWNEMVLKFCKSYNLPFANLFWYRRDG